MTPGTVLFTMIANALVLALGGVVTSLTWRAYRRTDWQVLRDLAAGFALITLGALLGGGVHHLLGTRFVDAVAVQSAVSAVGFALITYSLYERRPDDSDSSDEPTNPGTSTGGDPVGRRR